jgi:hypothetical protein
MTVSAFTEVSLEPPLVLVCADRSSTTRPLIDASGVFAVNILARDQEALSNRFASKKEESRRFEGLEYDLGPTGAPLLRGVVANLDCRVVATHGPALLRPRAAALLRRRLRLLRARLDLWARERAGGAPAPQLRSLRALQARRRCALTPVRLR